MSYDANNIFARILRAEIPSHRVYENEHVIAFMDVMPQAAGHTLVVPKAASRNLFDADPQTLAQLMPVVQQIARAVQAAFNADGIQVIQYNEAAAGQTVFHLHVHVIPRHADVVLKRHGGQMEDNAVLATHAGAIRTALATLS